MYIISKYFYALFNFYTTVLFIYFLKEGVEAVFTLDFHKYIHVSVGVFLHV